MDHISGTSSVRKTSVNTLLKHTLQLSNQSPGPTTALLPENKIKLKPIGEPNGGGTDAVYLTGRERGRDRGGFTSCRSTTRDNSLTTTSSSAATLDTCRSMRNLIEEIESKAKDGQLSPRFVTDIRSLSPEKFSWTKNPVSPKSSRRKMGRSRSPSPKDSARISSRSRMITARGEGGSFVGDASALVVGPQRPQLNVIGCQQNVELILSKADERIRKQLLARQMRETAHREERERIEAVIHATLHRAEIRAEKLKVEAEQKFIMKIITMAIYIKQLRRIFFEDLNRHRILSRISTARRRISMVCISWRKRKNAFRYLQIIKNIMRNHSFFMLQLRILYKRLCVKRILKFFDEVVNCKKNAANIVQRYIRAVKLVQRTIRSFLVCRLEKIRTALIIWDRLEMNYLKSVLTERKAKFMELKSKKLQRSMKLNIEVQTELDRQSKRWEAAEVKLQRALEVHRKRGIIMEETSESEVLSFMLPYNVKFKIIAGILKSKRKEYVLNMEDIKRAAAQDAKFSTQDALLFLGNNSNNTASAPAPASTTEAPTGGAPVPSLRRKSSAGMPRHDSGGLQRQTTMSNVSASSRSDGATDASRKGSRSRSNTEEFYTRPRGASNENPSDQNPGVGALTKQPSIVTKSVSSGSNPAPTVTAEALILRSANATAVATSALHQRLNKRKQRMMRVIFQFVFFKPLQHKEIMAAIIKAHKEATTFADAVSETGDDHTGGMITHQGLLQHNAVQEELQCERRHHAAGLGAGVG